MHRVIRSLVAGTHCFLRAQQKSRPRGPGLSLPERICLASMLVFGDDRSRTPQVKVIVEAGADDIAPEACPRDGSAVGKENARDVEILQRAEAERHAAEIVVQIFGLDAPIGKKQPFDAAARRPADARIGKAAKRAIGVGQGCSVFDELRDTGARPRLTISQTAGSVDKQSWRDGKAQPAAHGAEVIESSAGRQDLINRIGWETSDRRLAKPGG